MTSRAESWQLGRYVLTMVKRGLASLARARDRAPDRFLAVEYRELVADPVRTTAAIARWLGRALDPVGEARCRRFLAMQPHQPRHEYTLATYGLDERALTAG